MSTTTPFRVYSGEGSSLADRKLLLPTVEHLESATLPRAYLAEPGLRDALNVALALGQPLLLTGEPGTGKTQFANSVAWELGQLSPLVFNTKTTSVARDLFYRYDALAHFHDAQFRKETARTDDYITFEALGLAILRALDPAQTDGLLTPEQRGGVPSRSVVLIDEIDKAPRDLPNDVLNEIEHMTFSVRETGRVFRADPRFMPIVILTSNSEKTLPDPFLRRCVFYHLAFPGRERLRGIVARRLGADLTMGPAAVEHAISRFEEIRELSLRKKPATSELLAWIRVLDRLTIDVANLKPGEAETLTFTYSLLAKSREDLVTVRERFSGSGTAR